MKERFVCRKQQFSTRLLSRPISLPLLLLIVLGITTVTIYGQVSGGFDLQWALLAGGGDKRQSANAILEDSVGQMAAGVAASAAFRIDGGYLAAGSMDQNCYKLTLAHSGAGSDPVATPANSSSCAAGHYRPGESLAVNAAPSTGWWVGGWIGTSNDSAPAPNNVVLMPAADHQVIVNYVTTCYPLALTHSGAGSDPTAMPVQSASCLPGQHIAGEAISVHAAPDTGWRVAGWSGVTTPTNLSTDNSLLMPAGPHTVQVTYEQIPVSVPGDAYEEDNLCAQARTINVDGVGQAHSFHQAGDEDWLQFAAVANVPYRLEINIPTGSPADVILMLYEQCAASQIDQFDADFAPGARLDFTPLTTAPIYIRLRNKDPNVGGAHITYQATVRSLQSAAAPTNRALILVGGSLTTPDRLQSNITHVTNAVYAYFRANGYKAEDVIYLTNDATIAERTGAATLTALQQAITVWAKQRLTVGGEITLYFMDHGEADTFYLDNASGQVLTPQQLDSWLDQLESALPELKVTLIMEACYSGTFIDGDQSISKDEPGRLVLTSTSNRLLAYASNSGAYFSDFLLATLEQGYSLHNSFQATYGVVRELSGLRQEPWLDGNGNGIPNEVADITLSAQRGADNGGQGWAPYIVSIQPPTIQQQHGILQAVVRDDKKVRRVWAVITPPSYRPPEQSAELVAETLPTLVLLAQGNDTFAAEYPGFDELGSYRIAVYAEDEENLVTLPKSIDVSNGNRLFLPIVAR